jgi:hypothetical protein
LAGFGSGECENDLYLKMYRLSRKVSRFCPNRATEYGNIGWILYSANRNSSFPMFRKKIPSLNWSPRNLTNPFVYIYCRSFSSKEINMIFFKIPICKDRDA